MGGSQVRRLLLIPVLLVALVAVGCGGAPKGKCENGEWLMPIPITVTSGKVPVTTYSWVPMKEYGECAPGETPPNP